MTNFRQNKKKKYVNIVCENDRLAGTHNVIYLENRTILQQSQHVVFYIYQILELIWLSFLLQKYCWCFLFIREWNKQREDWIRYHGIFITTNYGPWSNVRCKYRTPWRVHAHCLLSSNRDVLIYEQLLNDSRLQSDAFANNML